MAFGFAGAGSSASDALTELLVQAQLQKQREAELALRQNADARAQREMAMREAEAATAAETRAANQRNTRAKLALDFTAPNAEVDPQTADLISQSDYATAIERKDTLPSRSMSGSMDNPQWTENAPKRYAFRRPTSAEQDGLNQQAQRRTISELFKRGAPRNERVAAAIEAGADPTSAMLNEDPAVARQAALDNQVRLAGIEHGNRMAEIGAQNAGRAGGPATATAAQMYTNEGTKRSVDMIDALLPRVSTWNTGLAGQVLGKVGGTPQHDFGADLEALSTNIGFMELQEMRNASKTGGALGQVSERETAMLQSVLGALRQSQSAEQLKTNLQRVRERLQEWDRIKQQYGAADAQPMKASPSHGGAPKTRKFNPATGKVE